MRFVLTLLPLLVYGICQVHGYATCLASGDPHFLTFDGQRYDFMGADEPGKECRFLFVGSCKAEGIPYFRVLALHSHRGNRKVSWVKALELHLSGHVIRIDHDLNSRGQIKVDGRIHTANNYRGVYRLTVTYFPPRETRFSFVGGKVLVVYRSYYAEAKVHSSLRGAGLCGLCGNYDGNKGNDQRQRNGQYGNWNQIGWSWEAPDQNGKYCTKDTTKPCRTSNCKAASQCSDLRQVSIFGQCVRHMKFYQACAEDACCATSQFRRCETFRVFVRECASIGVPVPNSWELETGCGDPSCPANSKYDQNASPCQRTCKGFIEDCETSKKKGACVCNNGYVWSNNKCVSRRSCVHVYK